MGLEIKQVNKKKIHITEYIQNFNDEKELMMQKGGIVTEIVTYGNTMEDSSDEENKKNKDQKKQLSNRGTV